MSGTSGKKVNKQADGNPPTAKERWYRVIVHSSKELGGVLQKVIRDYWDFVIEGYFSVRKHQLTFRVGSESLTLVELTRLEGSLGQPVQCLDARHSPRALKRLQILHAPDIQD